MAMDAIVSTEEISRMPLFVFFKDSSCKRCHKHYFRANIYLLTTLDVNGAALACVLSQCIVLIGIISLTLLWKLIKQVDQVPPTCKDLPFQRFIRNAASLAARLDQR
ncbi:uncharacterized protein LOC110811284 isoform X2 [Carica papaya]|uniref:uncharacterized protein LOC110811284 isoform X2 n=1 Tax=Carica papaya TaxID=3649 RepID=UPI000B8C81CB|nr:uncharacterized protein LOC110811284 isoform X2 [Carica papaya]